MPILDLSPSIVIITVYTYCEQIIQSLNCVPLRDLLKNLNTLKNLPFVNSQSKIFNNFTFLCVRVAN